MKDLGYHEGYRYAHDYEGGYAPQQHLPDELKGAVFYEPGTLGFEQRIAERMKYWEEKRKSHEGKK
jgi:putative ATPase